MNKTLAFFTAPVTALFLPQVHRDAVRNSAWRGVLYLLYLAFISTVFFLILFSTIVVPQGNEFAKWFGANMPPMVWTPQGLVLENQQLVQPLRMEHPQFGLIAVFDMQKTAVTGKDLEGAYLFVTSRKVYLKKAPGQIQEYDVTRNAQQSQQLPPRIRITGEVAQKFYQNIKNAIFWIMPVFIFIVVFFLYLFGSLIYSLAGLLFNLMRKNKLSYGAVFNLTCFATTAGFTLMWLKVMSPLRDLPFPFFLYVLINLVYMFGAFKITDQETTKA